MVKFLAGTIGVTLLKKLWPHSPSYSVCIRGFLACR